jgi:Na+-transporting methylmalonyl-CoA/oxaloacetate decarboxylase gamma subunit
MDSEATAMTRGIGMLVGTLLMLAIFLLALSAGISPSSVRVPVPVPTQAPVPAEEVAIKQVVSPATEASSPDDDITITPQSWNQSMASYETTYRNEATEVSRYLVWSPFRSEWAAKGFARRLTLATEVPMEVINEGPENFQVVFGYRDEDERQALVTQIENVTGLELE